jgi:sugar transferase (PEP-CTERM system associated)
VAILCAGAYLRIGALTVLRRSIAASHCMLLSAFRSPVSPALLVQVAAELCCLLGVTTAAIYLHGSMSTSFHAIAVSALVFAVPVLLVNVILGMYGRRERLTSSSYLARVLLAPAVGIPLASLIVDVLPGIRPLPENLVALIIVTSLSLLVVRHVVVLPLIAAFVPHRILVLGTGEQAQMVEASLAAGTLGNITLLGFYALDKGEETAVSASRIITRGSALEDTVRQLGAHEIIVAVRQQRGGVLPLRALLDCRLRGIQVTDLARFFERVHGLVPIDSVKVSWLIYGEGYRQNWMRALVKRLFDITVSAGLLVLAAPVMILAAVLIAMESPGPVIYRQERVGLRGRTFTLLKFRSMSKDAEKDGKAAWASANDARITRIGRLLRRTRMDELPQLINVIKGEMSFVGPRPERPEFVTMLTEQIPFYAVRNSVKPGLTGWAQVRYSYGATVEQAVKKLEYDLYYVKNHTLVLDLVILLETVRVVLLGEGAR